jgi:hypothetical protein
MTKEEVATAFEPLAHARKSVRNDKKALAMTLFLVSHPEEAALLSL